RELRPERLEARGEVRADALDVGFAEQAACDARLIGHERDPVAVLGQEPNAALGAGRKPYPRRIDVVGHVLDERAVLVEQHRTAARRGGGRQRLPRRHPLDRPRRQGHDVSRSGTTRSSGITVPRGWHSTKRTAAATLAGSWSTA